VHSLGPFSQEGPLNERGVKKKGKAFSSFGLRQSVIRTSSLSRYIPPPSCRPLRPSQKPAHKGADGNLKNKHFSMPSGSPLCGWEGGDRPQGDVYAKESSVFFSFPAQRKGCSKERKSIFLLPTSSIRHSYFVTLPTHPPSVMPPDQVRGRLTLRPSQKRH
jgi:hypothetical protein